MVHHRGAAAGLPHVLCVGGANLDHVVELDALPNGEDKQLARTARWSGGGIAATAAVAVSRLGARASWCGLLGDDNAGRMVATGLVDAGVRLSPNAVVPGASTPTAVVLVDADGRRWLGWHRGTGLDVDGTPPLLPDLGSVGAVLADLSSGAVSVSALTQAAARGLPRVLDMEAADADSGRVLAALADHIVFSGDGLRRYTGIDDVEAALTMAASRLPHATVGVTLGPRGSAWYDRDAIVIVPAPALRARDTTGCGDVFHGAYALALAEGRSVPDSARFATAAAALKAERGNGWDGMPSRTDTDDLLSKGWT